MQSLEGRCVGSWSRAEVEQLVDAVRQVAGSANTPPGAVPWQAVAVLHPTRTWLQLCSKWSSVYYLHADIIAQREAEANRQLAPVTMVRVVVGGFLNPKNHTLC
jgi:hypothetical protein